MSGLNSSSVSVAPAPASRKCNPDFSKGKIYFLRSKLDPRIYIGSTTDPERREYDHKSTAWRGERMSKQYKIMREVGIDSYYLEVVEDYPCNSEEELEHREYSYIEECPPAILLNTDLKYGERSEEAKEKIRESWTEERRAEQSRKLIASWTDERRAEQSKVSGSKHPQFKGGCCYHDPAQKRWRVKWTPGIGQKPTTRSFGYGPKGKYSSEEEARKSAEEFKASLTFD